MKRFLLAVAVLAPVPAALGQVAIWDNTTNYLNNNMPLLPEWRTDSAEVGDDIWLAGTARTVTELTVLVWYRGTVPGTVDARVRFRPLLELEQTPDAALWESDLIQSLPTVHGMNEYKFSIPNVTVPDHVVWTIQMYNRQGSVGELGPAYFNPPTVGFSDDFFWQSDMGGEWIPYSWGADPFANFGARIMAVVPEPATVLALAAGAGFLLRRRRKS